MTLISKPSIQIKSQEEYASPELHLSYYQIDKNNLNKRILITMSYEDIKSNYVKLGLLLKRKDLKAKK